jgi:tRNA-2-methylthio-N6-dimethylallyladenosine synthase
MPKTFYIRTFGCQMNEHDSERLAGMLVADGMEPTEMMEQADVVVLNTCCIRENADQKLYGTLGSLKTLVDAKPGLQIAVGGCLAQKDRELIQEKVGWVDAVFGTHNLSSAPGLLRRAATEGQVMEILDAPDPETISNHLMAPAAVRELPYAAWVNIQMGCDNSCAFCIVPTVRGPEVSRPVNDIVGEVEELARRGVIEVTLLGQNVNSYGRDITHRRPLFADLLGRIGAVDGIGRIRFTSPHPKDLRPETIAAMADTPEVCEQLHLPLQSGSSRVLSAMRRGYTAERYLDRLAAARAAIDDLAVTTDIIVGFPGETERDFEDTLAVAAEAAYDSAYTFIFSPRPGTRAADMEDDFIAPDVIAHRFGRLKTVVERSALARHQARVGRVEEVLVEGVSRRDESMLTGRTRQGKLVHFAAIGPGMAGTPVAGCVARVTITAGHPHHLSGVLGVVTARPRHRVRIPVASA